MIGVSGFIGLYIFMLAAFAGWIIIGRVPAILHTPLMSGSNFVHGIVVIGGIFVLLNATTVTEQAIGFFAVLLGAGIPYLKGAHKAKLKLLGHKPFDNGVVRLHYAKERA